MKMIELLTISKKGNAFGKNIKELSQDEENNNKEEILLGAQYREGLSAIDIASRIIERKKEIGIDIGPLPSGADNKEIQMEVIRIEEIVNAIKTKMLIEAAFPLGVSVVVTGANAGGPFVAKGATTENVKGVGVGR
jgi:hypothetical protein